MGTRSRSLIETNRGVLVADPTAIQRPGAGEVELTGGASGSVDGITVDSVEIMSGAVSFNTSLTQTALDVVSNINANTSSPDYRAYSYQAKIKIYQQAIVAGTLTVTSSSTTITTSDTNVTGGAAGDGDVLGYTESGFEFEPGDSYIEDPTEETGQGMGTVFFGGGDPILRVVLKQYDVEVLKARFKERFDEENRRVQFPGTLLPGDDMTDNSILLEFRPDNVNHRSMLARVAVPIGRGDEPIRFRTQEAKKLALEFRCLEDESIGSGDARYKYRVAAIGPAYNITL